MNVSYLHIFGEELSVEGEGRNLGREMVKCCFQLSFAEVQRTKNVGTVLVSL